MEDLFAKPRIIFGIDATGSKVKGNNRNSLPLRFSPSFFEYFHALFNQAMRLVRTLSKDGRGGQHLMRPESTTLLVFEQVLLFLAGYSLLAIASIIDRMRPSRSVARQAERRIELKPAPGAPFALFILHSSSVGRSKKLLRWNGVSWKAVNEVVQAQADATESRHEYLSLTRVVKRHPEGDW